MRQMILVLFRALHIHVASVPVAMFRGRLWSPMSPDAEFCVGKPVRDFISLQRLGSWLEKSLRVLHRTECCNRLRNTQRRDRSREDSNGSSSVHNLSMCRHVSAARNKRPGSKATRNNPLEGAFLKPRCTGWIIRDLSHKLAVSVPFLAPLPMQVRSRKGTIYRALCVTPTRSRDVRGKGPSREAR